MGSRRESHVLSRRQAMVRPAGNCFYSKPKLGTFVSVSGFSVGPRARPTLLVDINLLKTQSLQQTGDGGDPILLSAAQYAVG